MLGMQPVVAEEGKALLHPGRFCGVAYSQITLAHVCRLLSSPERLPYQRSAVPYSHVCNLYTAVSSAMCRADDELAA